MAGDSGLRREVVGKLRECWSPQQIAAWLAQTFPDRPELRVCHETIYQAIYVQSRGNLRAELAGQLTLRSGRAARKAQSRGARAGRTKRPWIGELHISTRPAEAADRAVPGHWEGDLLIGARGSSAIVTLIDLATRYVMLGSARPSLYLNVLASGQGMAYPARDYEDWLRRAGFPTVDTVCGLAYEHGLTMGVKD